MISNALICCNSTVSTRYTPTHFLLLHIQPQIAIAQLAKYCIRLKAPSKNQIKPGDPRPCTIGEWHQILWWQPWQTWLGLGQMILRFSCSVTGGLCCEVLVPCEWQKPTWVARCTRCLQTVWSWTGSCLITHNYTVYHLVYTLTQLILITHSRWQE